MIWRQPQMLAPLRRSHHLDLAGALEEEDLGPALRSRRADCQRAMVPQHHGVLVAEVGHQTLALVEVQRDAFIVVVG